MEVLVYQVLGMFVYFTIRFFPLIWYISSDISGLPWWLSGKESPCQCRTRGFDLWVRKIPWRRKWQPTPVLLPGKFHGQRSLGYSPWGHKESDMTDHARACTYIKRNPFPSSLPLFLPLSFLPSFYPSFPNYLSSANLCSWYQEEKNEQKGLNLCLRGN